jgi:Ricin-type beta-trefoil lectin domain-like
VIGNHLQQPQFLPFIRYRLQFVRSQMLLAVNQANRAPGTELLQLPGDGKVAQDFSFEDAGNGFVYIRSHVSNLYVTVEAPDVVTGGTTAASAAPDVVSGNATGSAAAHEASPTDSIPPKPGIIQDLKYAPTHVIFVLEPIFEADLDPSAYGYRPKRGGLDAIKEVHALAPNGPSCRSGGCRRWASRFSTATCT